MEMIELVAVKLLVLVSSVGGEDSKYTRPAEAIVERSHAINIVVNCLPPVLKPFVQLFP